jgi:hypothetical protein
MVGRAQRRTLSRSDSIVAWSPSRIAAGATITALG